MEDQIEVGDRVSRVADVPGGILVGHDGSPCARVALRWAAALAARTGWDLHVLRAWTLTTAPRPASWAVEYVPPLHEWADAVGAELAADVRAGWLVPGPGVLLHVALGSPAGRLLGSAAHADLLVVGQRGLGGFAGLLLGSVSDQCVRHAPCPVTVVRPRADDRHRH
jgi:nucleotide-binding universal stress UspA family protein